MAINKCKIYDLEDRTLLFAKDVREFTKNLPKTIPNYEYIPQLIRSSGSVGANYIEANEAFSNKDFLLRIKISRKEVKEQILVNACRNWAISRSGEAESSLNPRSN